MTSGYVGGDREFWWDELEALLLEPGSLPAKLELPIQGVKLHRWEPRRGGRVLGRGLGALPPLDRVRSGADRAARLVLDFVATAATCCAEPERQVALRALRQLGSAGRNKSARRTGNFRLRELVSLHDAGPGRDRSAHGHSPASWTTFRPTLQRDELRHIEETRWKRCSAHSVRSFAFPYGAHSTALVSVVRDAGYTCACTTEQQVVPRGADPFRLPRLEVQ